MREEKKTMEVTEYTCSYCNRVTSLSKRKVERHEKKCSSQPFQITPNEWGVADSVDDRGVGIFAEQLVQDAVRETPLHDYDSEGSGIDLEYPWWMSYPCHDYLATVARHAEDVQAILKNPRFMVAVVTRANDLKMKAVKLVAKWAKEVKLEIPTELEDPEDVPKDEGMD